MPVGGTSSAQLREMNAGSQPDVGSIADVTHLLAGVIHRRQIP
jgi:hypothetical protein